MSLYLFGSILNLAVFYMISSSGILLGLKSGNVNLGNEGQIYTGGFVAALILVKYQNLPLSFLLAGLSGAFLTLISAALKYFRKTDMLISSFLVSSLIIPVIDTLLLKTVNGQNLMATPFIPETVRFTKLLPPSPLNSACFFGIFIVAAVFLILNKTDYGKKLCIYGTSPKFAVYRGFNTTLLDFSSIAATGFLNGITGMIAVAGTYYTCHQGFYANLGWNSLSVALLSQTNAFLIIPSSLIIVLLTQLTSQFALLNNFNFDISLFLQGLILLAIVFISRNNLKSGGISGAKA